MVLQDKSEFRFVPESALGQLFSRQVVSAALERHKSNLGTDIPKLVTFVCEKAMKVFAILVWNEDVVRIEQFYRHNSGDEHLPVSCKYNDTGGYIGAVSYRLGIESIIDSHPFNNQDQWSERTRDYFCDYDQWPFLSPVFSENQFRYAFHDLTHMPFVEASCRNQKNSYFSVVEEWRIHRAHMQMPNLISMPSDPNEHPSVAVKELRRMSLNDQEFDAVAEAEVNALEMIRELNHPHLIKAIAYYTKGKKHYILFPWAGRGNLREFWKEEPRKLNPQYLKWVFTQLCGLASAIERLHHFHKERPTRHGDLKPENVLCFPHKDKQGDAHEGSCILVIADVGLAKSHDEATKFRKDATRTKSGTITYEPPETELQPDLPRSRRYDVWSLGCIYLEFVIWLLYGALELDHFRKDLSLGGDTRFYVLVQNQDTRTKTARLNNVVQKWIDWIRKDPRCPKKTALRNLVELVVTRLLVPDVRDAPSLVPRRTLATIDSSDPSTPTFNLRPPTFIGKLGPRDGSISRASAEEMNEEMKSIFEDATSLTSKRLKWMIWDAPTQQGPRNYGNLLDPSARPNVKDQEPLDDNWKYTADADTARNIFSDSGLCASLVSSIEPPQLCGRCTGQQLWRSRHIFTDTLAGLRQKSSYCALCRLLLKHVDGHVVDESSNVRFFRVGSSLTFIDRQRQPIVSLYTLPSSNTLGLGPPVSDLPIGFPQLHDAGTSTHMRVLAEWIHSCNKTHQCYPKDDNFLPTRVLDVGTDASTTVQLFCSTQNRTRQGKYCALSHRWGLPAQHCMFSTTIANLEQHKRGIDITKLPKTFRDAVNVTRALDMQYLWIDSLCIVQDDTLDWEKESKLMEQVYSSAYVTLAASCASGTWDGFLKPRPERECVIMKKDDGSSYYMCDAIDDFGQDVDQGELNKRGWVLQERVLSRRTIYFTAKQSYWECGEGVRCETLTKMKNKKASFLGDSNFPHSVEAYVKGMKIQLFQGLYERYTNLALSFSIDRPVAIKGLEKRLIRTLKTVGGYGVFECYLHRCLLWQRATGPLKRIEGFRGGSVPTWSWMMCTGGIKYMDVPFGKVLWAEDICSPFESQRQDAAEHAEEGASSIGIRARAWSLSNPQDQGLILDDTDRVFTGPLKCVIVGTDREVIPGRLKNHYVLVVAMAHESDSQLYERVGVGILQEAQIKRDVPAIDVQII
ncbi:hypothetical protein K504DRAFT_390780 [Pleomassaria siparia CBS 279.74]|uniref:Protein kinase domain-containing protein n=1 Tax=Pleomassaria siparia CBS 279.74 TaxID=1314801 RepID=A0A6G1JV00_9PLEO|nr:hypothetical protein K504DRAFT_390780 [Pleomassaria siparia CBS 279.74]